MTKLYFLLVALCGTVALQAQTITVPGNLDGTDDFEFTYINLYIDADTTDAGEQNNDVYLLEAGATYFFTTRATWDFDVTLRATGDVESLGKPIIDRTSISGGDLVEIYQGTGSLTFDGLYMILGQETDPSSAAFETRPIRPEGDNTRYVFNNCIIEKSRQGTIRSEGENVSVFVTNNHLFNFGDYGQVQGNGRVVDLRDNFGDSVVITGNVIHNILDRMYIGFRQRGLNYFEFSENTVFNHVGRHGFIQLNQTKESVIENNFIQNPNILGSRARFSDEQGPADVGIMTPVFSLDSMVPDASITMSNNNIFWTQDVLDQYASLDSVSKPMMFNQLFIDLLGDTTDAYFSEVLELNNVPSRDPILQYANEVNLDPDAAAGLTTIIVEKESFAGTDFDRGYLFDFSDGDGDDERFNDFDAFDPCYDASSQSASAGTDGGAVGATSFCADLTPVAVRDVNFNRNLHLRAMPNPASNYIRFTYDIQQSGPVALQIYDAGGRKIADLINTDLPSGEHTFTWDQLNSAPAGLYFANLRTATGRMYVKFFKH